MNRRAFIFRTLAGTALSTVSASVGACSKNLHQISDCDRCGSPECEPFGCHYTRMFPHLARRPSTPGSTLEKGLEALGKRMIDHDEVPDGTSPAGYTYFGQFRDG